MSRRVRSSRQRHAPVAQPQPCKDPSTPSILVWVALALYVLFGLAHVLYVPVVSEGSLINAPDESAHIGYVRAIAEGRRLPTRNDPQFPTYQWHQPPLYYTIAALGAPLGPIGMRLVSLLFGVLSLLVILATVRLLIPDRPHAQALAVGFAALLPMRHAITAAVGNDAATELAFSTSLYLIASQAARGWTARGAAFLGLSIGLGILSKASCVLLLPVAAIAGFLSVPRPSVAAGIARAAIPVLVGLALATPWFVRNQLTYGQPMPLRAFHAEFAQTSRAADWIGKQRLSVDWTTGDLRAGPVMDRGGYVALLASWTARTLCAAYTPLSRAAIGAPVFMPPAFYAVWWALLATGLVAGFLPVADYARARRELRPYLVSGGLCVALVLASFIGFVCTYFQAQGRYLYPALSVVSAFWSMGICAMTRCEDRRLAAPLVLGVLALLAAGFLFAGVIPAYAERVP